MRHHFPTRSQLEVRSRSLESLSFLHATHSSPPLQTKERHISQLEAQTTPLLGTHSLTPTPTPPSPSPSASQPHPQTPAPSSSPRPTKPTPDKKTTQVSTLPSQAPRRASRSGPPRARVPPTGTHPRPSHRPQAGQEGPRIWWRLRRAGMRRARAGAVPLWSGFGLEGDGLRERAGMVMIRGTYRDRGGAVGTLRTPEASPATQHDTHRQNSPQQARHSANAAEW